MTWYEHRNLVTRFVNLKLPNTTIYPVYFSVLGFLTNDRFWRHRSLSVQIQYNFFRELKEVSLTYDVGIVCQYCMPPKGQVFFYGPQ